MRLEKIKILHLGFPEALLSELERQLLNLDLEIQYLEVDSEEQFLGALEAFIPDVILTSQGQELLDWEKDLVVLRSCRTRFPLIEVAPGAAASYVRESFRAGVDDVVLDLEDLPQSLLELLTAEKVTQREEKELSENFSLHTIKSGLGKPSLESLKVPALVIKTEASVNKDFGIEFGSSVRDYKNLFQLSPLPNLIYDRDSLLILDVNQAALDQYGYTREEFLQLSLLDLRPETEVEVLKENLKESWKNSRKYTPGVAHKKKDESSFYVDIYGHAVNFGRHNARLVICIDVTEKVFAKKLLEETNTSFELATRATFDAIYDMNIEKGKLYWNPGHSSLFGHGVSKDGEDPYRWTNHIHPEDKLRVVNGFQAALDGGETHFKESYRYKKANGDYAWVIDRALILRDDKGTPVRIAGALKDFTKKKRLEDLLRNSNCLSRIGSFEVDILKSKVYWSSIVREIHEVGPDFEPDFVNIFSFIEEAERKDILEIFEKSVRENIVYDFETRITTAKGNKVWVRFMGQPEYEFETCIGIKGSLQDITKIKQAQLDALKAFEEKESILETIGDGFIAVDEECSVTYWNQQAELLLNETKEKAVGKKLWECFPEDTGSVLLQKLQNSLKKGEKINMEVFYKKQGEWYEVTAYPGKHGSAVYFRNISERKKNERQLLKLNESLQQHTEELVAANKGLEQFSFIVSHNLRSPVANIMGLAEILQMEDTPEEVVEEMQQEIINNVKRLDDVITDLNGILRVKKDISERKEQVNLQELVESIKASFGQHLDSEGVKIFTKFEVPEILTIKSYLYSIFYNLISNSIKYRQLNLPPEIRISTWKRKGSVFLSFQDNGLGIDLSKKKEEVFGLYKRFHSHVQGKGMGLFMVKTQVEMLGGKISIASEPDKGTSFHIEFKD